jgi:hypothetical protein
MAPTVSDAPVTPKVETDVSVGADLTRPIISWSGKHGLIDSKAKPHAE